MDQLLTFIAANPLLVGAFAVVLIALIATEFSRATRRWKELSTAEAIFLINRREPLIIDVSNSGDHASGHILNALHMPPSRIEAGNKELLKSVQRPVLVYCKNGQVSPQMAARLVGLGFEDVNVLRGGLAQWIADQQPVVRPRGSGGKSKSGAGKNKGGAGKNKGSAGSNKRGAARKSRGRNDSGPGEKSGDNASGTD